MNKCSRRKKQATFSGQEDSGRLRVNIDYCVDESVDPDQKAADLVLHFVQNGQALRKPGMNIVPLSGQLQFMTFFIAHQYQPKGQK